MLNSNILNTISANYQTPVYVYDFASVKANYKTLTSNIQYAQTSVHFAAMANNSVAVHQSMRKLGIKSFVATPEELFIAQTAGYEKREILFCGNNLSQADIVEVANSGVDVIAESIEQMIKFGDAGNINRMGIRLCFEPSFYNKINEPDIQRLGIPISLWGDALAVAKEYAIKIAGLHTYIGTNIKDFAPFADAVSFLTEQAKQLDDLQYIDISGGFGISYKDDTFPFNWVSFGEIITGKMKILSAHFNRDIELKLEPGRALIANAAVLLTTVTEVKRHGSKVFIGLDTSLSNFARPYIYKEYHKIHVLNGQSGGELEEHVFICGNSAKSDDFFACDISFPKVIQGDILMITNVGAYGFSMSSNFCSKLKPMELLVDENLDARVIRDRETKAGLLLNQNY